MFEHVVASSESELSASISLLNSELKKVSLSLSQSLELLRRARGRGVVTERLVSLYNETKILKNPLQVLKSFLRSKFELKGLIRYIKV